MNATNPTNAKWFRQWLRPIKKGAIANMYVNSDLCHHMVKLPTNEGFHSHPSGVIHWQSGPWFNIKMSSYQYRKSHCGDKTVVRSSYLHNGISYTGKMSSLYWIGTQMVIPMICSEVTLKDMGEYILWFHQELYDKHNKRNENKPHMFVCCEICGTWVMR